MTRLWKKRIHESLVVLTVLTSVQICWSYDGHEPRKLGMSVNAFGTNSLDGGSVLEIVLETTSDAGTLQYYLSHWKEGVIEDSQQADNTTYLGEGLPEVFFQSSTENNSLILSDLSRCLNDFRFLTCLKFLLVNKLDDLLEYIKKNNLTETDFSFAHGIVNFESVQGVNHYDVRSVNDGVLGLDEDITYKIMELFRDRSLQLNLLPGIGFDVAPVPADRPEDIIGIRAKPYFAWDFWNSADEGTDQNEARAKSKKTKNNGKQKRKKGGFKMPPLMIMPQLIMWGTMPFVLANLQAMVMNAFMINMMALNSAIFMTIRNLVFGPKGGPKIKYVNYGYKKKKKSSVPTIIVHSPAAFVKQPFHKFRRHKRPPHHHQPFFKDHFLPPENVIIAEGEHPPFKSPDYSSINYHIHDGDIYDEYQHSNTDHVPVSENGIRVIPEGRFNGKNRVRIKVDKGNLGMKEVLHRVKAVEEAVIRDEGIHSGYPEHGYVDDTPWTVSQPSTSHIISETQLADDVKNVNYDQGEFEPMLSYPGQ